MAVPPALIVGLGQAALNPKVQGFAGRLVSDVYSKLMPSKDAEVTDEQNSLEEASLDDILNRLNDMPTKEELATSFAFLQAELDRQNQKTRVFIISGFMVHIILLSIIILLVS